MSYDPARPRYTLPFAGKNYELVGSFGLIEAAEHALKDSVVSIAMRTVEMPVHEMAKLLASILTSCDHKATAKDVGETLWNELGVGTDAYSLLCLHVHAFLRICLAKPAEREEAARKMGELLGGLKGSPGETTSASA